MAATAGRKKSIISTAGLPTDAPVAHNTLLNKPASVSLYQRCSALRARLMQVRGFGYYFSLASPDNRQSTDPVTQLWDLFSLGIPLCYIFDQLPEDGGFNKINHSDFNQEQYEANPDRAQKHAIALFAMQIRSDKVASNIPGCELFTVTDLWNRDSTDGLVKVVETVAAIVKHLPPEAFETSPPSPALLASQDSYAGEQVPAPPANAKQTARINVLREMVDTERKYVQDLEVMQKYAAALSQSNLIDQDTIHLLFPNLNKLLNFQRKFLIKLEGIAELSWPDQRWGQPFVQTEEEFMCYEPYAANYTNAADLVSANEQTLAALNHLINVKGLDAFLIKPIQRICKYPLLFDSLIKATSAAEYAYFDELEAGSQAVKRIADKINEARRRAENEQTVKSLQSRVDDWKGHHLENFGELLLDDLFVVTKSDIDREYHVFLFEKIILCCKEALAAPPGKKVSKSNSILKKQSAPPTLSLPGGVGQPQRRNTPLLLKGRIFLGNVTQAVPVSPRTSTASGIPTHYPLAVWWKGDDDLEFFTLRCRTEDQRRQWETQINRLIRESAQRRASERGMSKIANSTNPRQPSLFATASQTSGYMSQANYSTRSRGDSVYNQAPPAGNNFYGGPQGYPPSDNFGFDPDEDDLEDYPPSNYPPSGRGTPMGNRRMNAQSLPPEHDAIPGYDRPRAVTEDTNGPVMAQWRNNNLPPSAAATVRSRQNRINSSASSYSPSENGSIGAGQRPRPPLRSQFSSTRLGSDFRTPGLPPAPSPAPSSALPPAPAPIMSRSRSASQPQAYVPRAVPPPLPVNNNNSNQWNSSNRRESGSSQSTGDNSSDYSHSPNSSSPITPFDSSESSLTGSSMHNGAGSHSPYPPVKIKVYFHQDIFVIQVPRMTEYEDLVEKVGRKIRLCGPRRDDGPLRVKYRDEDGDMVSLGSTEDVQMAFEHYRPGGQVTLYVT
ncbi:hypothetical protein MIND_00055500 [Mycena indigotica]|uniref:Rho guanine nucleotide exchange factor scd1 n=1 Tax=Mycena indigotica TaxID=2126181 RepID=A0A8H6WHT2_9AGAR|nr:uncharacterized protein MIND_00055500 [Mycena indigotica]KAF7315408.1 hypothetical protein MIND_00055500 [Mycena indigotica]